jgi:hypothetical protein
MGTFQAIFQLFLGQRQRAVVMVVVVVVVKCVVV